MSYDLMIDDEAVDQVASNNGWHETADFLRRKGKSESNALATDGVSTNPDELVKELEALAKEAPSDIRSVIEGICAHAKKAEHHVGVSQEGGDEDAQMGESVTMSRKLHDRLKWHGLNISIENDRGTEREWTARDGTKGKTLMKFPYGYIRVRS